MSALVRPVRPWSEMKTDIHALYRFYNSADQLLYIGITLDPGTRWKQHSHDKPWWTEVAAMTVATFPDRVAVLEAERQAIIAERPLRNVMHNPLVAEARRHSKKVPEHCPHCQEFYTYYPYHWRNHVATYMCRKGHMWRGVHGLHWGPLNGECPENRGITHSD